MATAAFDVRETHGIVMRSENRMRVSCDGHGWSSLYASAQREQPYEGHFPPVRDQLLVLHRNGPVAVERLDDGRPQRHVVPAGGVHLFPGGLPFNVRLMGELDTVHVYVRRKVIEEVAADMVEGDPALLEIPADIVDDDPALTGMLDAITLSLGDGDYATAIYMDHLARTIAAQLVRRHSQARLKSSRQPDVGADVVRALEYMQDNIARSFNLADLAKAAGRSPSHLSRQFRDAFGRPPHAYLIDLRLDMAQALLQRTREPIAAIAVDCGFSHQEHLTRLFRRRFETTPAAFRRRAQS
ncbi:helix-turn-helix domain-containing protein [Devosia ginsengisoli]|uniref:Helix-turn-helix transcriptional regulator n=1 Tax=Devosia ginsengisoli TaxID=400770 RepID=A0A5B8LQ10_9HYPH|nr:AraC family transcriptional regulator [Devosia ginsengisoli]QDZ09785.1 helix-turn-helix transcriptional regulator [Devosia ginsengisoli]